MKSARRSEVGSSPNPSATRNPEPPPTHLVRPEGRPREARQTPPAVPTPVARPGSGPPPGAAAPTHPSRASRPRPPAESSVSASGGRPPASEGFPTPRVRSRPRRRRGKQHAGESGTAAPHGARPSSRDSWGPPPPRTPGTPGAQNRDPDRKHRAAHHPERPVPATPPETGHYGTCRAPSGRSARGGQPARSGHPALGGPPRPLHAAGNRTLPDRQAPLGPGPQGEANRPDPATLRSEVHPVHFTPSGTGHYRTCRAPSGRPADRSNRPDPATLRSRSLEPGTRNRNPHRGSVKWLSPRAGPRA